MKVHPIANCFPALEGDELKALVEDIKQHGLQLPIITYEGAILDGRNRERACALAGVAPRYEEWKPRDENDTPLAFVTSVNLVRRHLSTKKRAAIAADLATMKSGTRTDLPPKGGRSISQAEAAKAMKVSVRSVQRAAARKRDRAAAVRALPARQRPELVVGRMLFQLFHWAAVLEPYVRADFPAELPAKLPKHGVVVPIADWPRIIDQAIRPYTRCAVSSGRNKAWMSRPLQPLRNKRGGDQIGARCGAMRSSHKRLHRGRDRRV